MKLIEVGAKLNVKDNDGSTALHMAPGEGSERIIDTPLEHHLDINAVDRYGRTALVFAIYQSNTQATVKLMEGGANLDVKDISGRCSLHEASREAL